MIHYEIQKQGMLVSGETREDLESMLSYFDLGYSIRARLGFMSDKSWRQYKRDLRDLLVMQENEASDAD